MRKLTSTRSVATSRSEERRKIVSDCVHAYTHTYIHTHTHPKEALKTKNILSTN